MPLRKKSDYIPIKIEGWNGKFVYDKNSSNNVSKIQRQNDNVSNWNNFYAQNKEPIILPTEWDGTFQRSSDPSDVRIQQERNRSDDSKFFGYTTEPEILPTEWDGSFQADPNDVRIKPERNASDVRDYAEASRFRRVN